jgi:hypothetical protein
MNFGDWLRAVDAEIRFSDVKLHLAVINPDKEDPLLLFRTGEFAEWQCGQTRRNFERPFVIAMIKTQELNVWLFAGVFESLGSRLIHSQKATMMARATPERKLSASLS